ncbi:MAG: PDR/VanB family oxidoreductase [Citricoccus sp.]
MSHSLLNRGEDPVSFENGLLRLEVTSKEVIADNVISLTLRHPLGEALPAWTPGAHVDVHVAGADGEELVRQYSLCSDPANRSVYRLGILREPASRGGSSYLHEQLQVGQQLDVSAPRNNFELREAPRYLFIAGGIGITPIIPLLEQAERNGAEWALHYGGRTRTAMAFAEEFERYGDRINLIPQDEQGFIDLAGILATPDPDTLVYCCGPGPLLDATEALTAAWPATALHMERFVNEVEANQSGDQAFQVELSLMGRTITVEPGVSVLDAVNAVGANVPHSCQEGTCGTCETIVLEGEPDHRDAVLSEEEREENEVMMVCVSRCKTPCLVLEL